MKAKLTFLVTLMVSFTLCIVVVGMVGVLMAGLFDEKVDNTEIFKLISPAFQTIVGGFIGLLAGVKLSHGETDEELKKSEVV
jgi:undecaprenyl pyrophosphate phosphatase UppP